MVTEYDISNSGCSGHDRILYLVMHSHLKTISTDFSVLTFVMVQNVFAKYNYKKKTKLCIIDFMFVQIQPVIHFHTGNNSVQL